MKMLRCLAVLSMITAVSFNQLQAEDQTKPEMMENSQSHSMGMGMGMGMGKGMGMGMGRGMGMGMMGGWSDIPDSLPKPKNAEWIKKLTDVLAVEKEAHAQYKVDSAKYHLRMPYRMIIHQESMHIEIIEDLFNSYGIKEESKPEKIVENKNLDEALENSIKIEQRLINDYVWLVKNAEDESASNALNRILIQSRWHLAMFQQLQSMGGKGMGPGMMMME